MIAASGEPVALDLVAQQRAGGVAERGERVELVGRQRGVELAARARATPRARTTRSRTDRRRFARFEAEQLVDGGSVDDDTEVEAIGDRTRQPAQVASARRRRRTRTTPGAPPPHGHGLVAATSRKRAGITARICARATRMTPSSSGSRRPSSAARPNSPSSSMNSTPLLASDTSPGRSWCEPPPTSPTTDVVWCGARNGGWRTSPPGGRRSPAAECTIVVSSACSRSSGGSRPGEALRQHRLAAARRTDEEQVVAAGGGDLQAPAGPPPGRAPR